MVGSRQWYQHSHSSSYRVFTHSQCSEQPVRLGGRILREAKVKVKSGFNFTNPGLFPYRPNQRLTYLGMGSRGKGFFFFLSFILKRSEEAHFTCWLRTRKCCPPAPHKHISDTQICHLPALGGRRWAGASLYLMPQPGPTCLSLRQPGETPLQVFVSQAFTSPADVVWPTYHLLLSSKTLKLSQTYLTVSETFESQSSTECPIRPRNVSVTRTWSPPNQELTVTHCDHPVPFPHWSFCPCPGDVLCKKRIQSQSTHRILLNLFSLPSMTLAVLKIKDLHFVACPSGWFLSAVSSWVD